MEKLLRVTRFIKHILSAKHTGGFGVHSPFVFEFFKNILEEKIPYYQFKTIEQIRFSVLSEKQSFFIRDLGSSIDRIPKIALSEANRLNNPRVGQLLFRIVEKYQCRNITELGTSTGIYTLYLASSSPQIKCLTFETCRQTAAKAKQNFVKAGSENIQLIEGNIAEMLSETLLREKPQDLFFLNASHILGNTPEIFNQCLNFCHDKSIIVINDIYRSDIMYKVWKQIIAHQRVTTSIDIYHMGFIFLNPELNKQNYKTTL